MRVGQVWPASLAAGEGVRTAQTGRWTSALIVAAVALLTAASTAADALGVNALIDQEAAWVAAGGRVLIATGPSIDGTPSALDAHTCDVLTELDGVTASFAMEDSGTAAAFAHVPGGRFTVYAVSSGAFDLLDVDAEPDGVVIVSTGLSSRTGVTDDESVALTVLTDSGSVGSTGSELQAHVTDLGRLGDQFDGALLAPQVLTGEADTCYVETDSSHYTALKDALPGLLATEAGSALVSTRLIQSEFAVDYSTAFQDRPLRWLWAAAAAVLSLVWVMVQWFRRSQNAIYATFSMGAFPRMIMQATEWAVLATAGGVLGWSGGVAFATASTGDLRTAALLGLTHTALALTGSSLVVIALGLRPARSLLAALKDG